MPAVGDAVKVSAYTAGLRTSLITCWAGTPVAGFLRVLINTELVGKSVKASPPNDKAVPAVAEVIRYKPCVIDPNVATETPAPAIALIAL